MRGEKKAWGSPIAHGAMQKRARPAPTKSAQGGRAPLHVMYVMRLFALRMKAGYVCFALLLEPPSVFWPKNVCLMHLPYCRFRRRVGVIKVIRSFTGRRKNRVPRAWRGTRAELAFPAGKSYFLFLSAVSRIKTATAAI